ncbi:hypothetical protein HMPREF9089_01088 [Eubacterium brachy ATCC 33089]|nr:hypothetical protein HMPREF9089_01088 [Eubacterium brachy ATCC 33089]
MYATSNKMMDNALKKLSKSIWQILHHALRQNAGIAQEKLACPALILVMT